MPRPDEPTPPPELVDLQRDFHQAITTPLRITDDGVEPRIEDFPAAIHDEIAHTGNHPGLFRLVVYNTGYWFRLLSVMQEEFPLLARVLGLRAFNELSMAYLHAHPSGSFTLNDLADRLLDFLDGDVGAADWATPLVREAAQLDRIYAVSFLAESKTPLVPDRLSPERRAGLAHAPLRFQPHWFRFEERWALNEARARVLREPADEDAPPMEIAEQRGWWGIYRHPRAGMRAVQLTRIQHVLLGHLAAGAPLEDACTLTAGEAVGAEREELAGGIAQWFGEWVDLGWFVS